MRLWNNNNFFQVVACRIAESNLHILNSVRSFYCHDDGAKMIKIFQNLLTDQGAEGFFFQYCFFVLDLHFSYRRLLETDDFEKHISATAPTLILLYFILLYRSH